MASFKSGSLSPARQVQPATKLVCKDCGHVEEAENATGLFCSQCGRVGRWRAWLSLILLDIVCLAFTALSTFVLVVTYPRDLDSFLFGFLAAFLALSTVLAAGLTLDAVRGLIATRRRYPGMTTKSG